MRALVCDVDETEIGRRSAPGNCPFCGGKVEAVDFFRRWRVCFVQACFGVKRKYICAHCSRRLVLYGAGAA